MEHLPVQAPLHALIIVHETIPHATAIMTTARIARRRSGSTSKSPITRMLAMLNTMAAKNGESKLTMLPAERHPTRKLGEQAKAGPLGAQGSGCHSQEEH
jgi:hypothetical protein